MHRVSVGEASNTSECTFLDTQNFVKPGRVSISQGNVALRRKYKAE